jgi:hypothetical protein
MRMWLQYYSNENRRPWGMPHDDQDDDGHDSGSVREAPKY